LRTPNLNALRMFDAAARHLNFRLAAEEMNLTQGAVAQQVRRLEADLGFQLFQRKARGLALSQIGRDYHEPVRRALHIIDEATIRLQPENTRITLSVTPSFASKWLVPRLADFTKAHPDIDVQTVASEGLADFRSDGVEIAIRQGHPPFGKGLNAKKLASLELSAVCSPDYGKKIGPVRVFEDFADHILIQDSHKHWKDLFERSDTVARHRMVQFNQTALAMDAAATGQGIALAPSLLIGAELSQDKLVELWRDERSDQSGFYIVWPNRAQANPSRDIVIDWIMSEVG
jgi:LysR family transcriptional regulator, glycine cleavage system transcriptional activator